MKTLSESLSRRLRAADPELVRQLQRTLLDAMCGADLHMVQSASPTTTTLLDEQLIQWREAVEAMHDEPERLEACSWVLQDIVRDSLTQLENAAALAALVAPTAH